MNASANLRRSYIRTSVLIPVPPAGDDSGDSSVKRRTLWPQGVEGDNAQRQQVVQTLDYRDYQARCVEQRDDSMPPPIKDYSLEDSTVEVEKSGSSRVRRMFTIFPYRDMSWVVTIMFVVGSSLFVAHAIMGLLPFINPALTTAPIVQPATILAGSCIFVVGGLCGLFAAFNANRGTLETSEGKSLEGGPNVVYRPALIGSAAWIWIPSMGHICALLKVLPFKAGLVLQLGGTILSISAVTGMPGVLDPRNFFLTQMLTFLPQVIGGSMFFVANCTLMIFAQEVWYKPNFGSGEWQGACSNAIGSAGLALTGVLLLQGNFPGASVVAFPAAFALLTGSVIQWYGLMEFHATRWAS
ncbi:hypothetical protein LX36DRAFT_263091 [Colletotrichum falcatum]|nr:hypothetical protein LX36DRAFT_263091 [Colletotrichum falcatum]